MDSTANKVSGTLLTAGLVLFLTGFVPMLDLEYWWSIALGRIIERWQLVPTQNLYTFTAPGAEVYVDSWLARWWMFRIHDALGLAGVLSLRNIFWGLMTAMTAWLATRRTKQGGAAFGAGLKMALVVLVLGVPWGPAAFASAMLLALVVLCVPKPAVTQGEEVMNTTFPRLGWVLFPLFGAIWVNVHHSFPFVVLVPLALFITTRKKAWGAASFLGFVGTICSPRGAEVWLRIGDSIQAAGWLELGLILLGFALLKTLKNARTETVLVAVFLLVAAVQIHTLIVVFPAVLLLLSRGLPTVNVSRFWPLALLVVLLGVLAQPSWAFHASLPSAFKGLRSTEPMRGLVPSGLPVEHAGLLKVRGTSPRIFHDVTYSGFLAWVLTDADQPPVLFVAPSEGLKGKQVQGLAETIERTDAWRGVFQQYGIHSAILRLPEQRVLAEKLAIHPDWSVAYETPHTILFLKRNTGNAP